MVRFPKRNQKAKITIKKEKRKKTTRHKLGFTLIELTIAIAIIVLIVALTLPRMISHDRMAVAHELNSLHTTVISLQHKAMVSNTRQVLTIDPQHHSYSWPGHTHKLHHGVRFGYLPHVKGPPSSPTRPIRSACSLRGNQIVVHSDGHIDPGSVYMIALKSNVMYALCIGVSQVSFVRKYRYTRTWNLV